MTDNVNINVNGVEIQSEPNKLLIEACEDSGIHIPRFCWHKRLDPVGMCRMCLVEIETPRGKMLVPSCTTNVTEDMVVDTESETVKKAQEGVLEFLLINHPLDCPICDKAGECPLQDQTMAYGPGESRFIEEKRHFEKPINISEIILLDRERCILCARCTRFSDEISGDPLIEFIQRGNKTQVNTFPNEPFKSYFSGNTVQICPVGALTSTSYRFKARPWDLKSTTSTCTGCSVGCTIELNSSQNKMLRILGVDNEEVNQGWLCDKGRYNFEYLNSKNRILNPLIRQNDSFSETGFQEIYSYIKNNVIEQSKKVKFLMGTNISNEDMLAYKHLSETLSEEVEVYLNDDNLFEGFFSEDISLGTISDLNKSDTIIVWAEDIKENLPVLYLRLRQAVKNGVKLVVFGPNNKTLEDVATKIYGKGIISENLEIVESLDQIDGLTEYIKDQKTFLVIGKSSPVQSSNSLEKLVNFVNENSKMKLMNAFSSGNIYGAFQTFNNLKGTKEFVNHVNSKNTDTLFVIGADPVGDSIYSTKIKEIISDVQNVISIDMFLHETSELANCVIPTSATLGENVGTFTNIEFRTSRIDKLVPSPGKTLGDWEFVSNLLSFCEVDYQYHSVEALNDAAYASLEQNQKPIFDNLNKPSNFDGILNYVKPNISCTDESDIKSSFLLGKKLYGDKVTQRNSESISMLGSRRYIELNQNTANSFNLDSGKCNMIQGDFELTVDYFINDDLDDGVVFVPTNRRDLNKFDFSKDIEFNPSQAKESLNVT
jgi:NADH-quinone oxidoreductase subunit G